MLHRFDQLLHGHRLVGDDGDGVVGDDDVVAVGAATARGLRGIGRRDDARVRPAGGIGAVAALTGIGFNRVDAEFPVGCQLGPGRGLVADFGQGRDDWFAGCESADKVGAHLRLRCAALFMAYTLPMFADNPVDYVSQAVAFTVDAFARYPIAGAERAVARVSKSGTRAIAKNEAADEYASARDKAQSRHPHGPSFPPK